MKSRYGLWIISVCWIGLAGCSNWQNRTNNANGPGAAATFSTAPAPGSPMMPGPNAAFGDPPPPVPPPPSDPNMTLAPLGSTPERLDLSAAEPVQPPQAMYNLESSAKPAVSKASSSSTGKPGAGNSTINRLASKAKSSESASAAPAGEKPAGSAISRLSAQASKSRSGENKEAAAPVKKKSDAESGTADPLLDTAFLAQPVRKGETGNGDSGGSKNGPQSNAGPGDKSLFDSNKKPVIYPVSNPAADEPVDITQFS